jgi:hypothetical protein
VAGPPALRLEIGAPPAATAPPRVLRPRDA